MPRPLNSPRPPRYDAAKAISDLSSADPKLGKLIERAGPFTMRVASAQSPFEALVESIIYQQLHGKAAATIHRRLLESFAPVLTLEAAGTGAHPTPQHLLDCPNEQLRAAGLSKNKMLALRDLAAKTIDGTVPALIQIRRMSDEAIIEHLTQAQTHRQSHSHGPPQTRRHAAPSKKVATLVLRRQLVSLASLRLRQRQ